MSDIFERRNKIEKKFKIVTDGFTATTKIYYGDEEVQGVTNVNINIDAEHPVVMATFTVLEPIINAEIRKDDIVFISHEHSKLLTEQKIVDKDSTS